MEIYPFKGVGSLLFSDTRDEIRRKLNQGLHADVREFGEVREHSDYFRESDLNVIYDTFNNINAFEFYSPRLTFNGIDLLSEPFIYVVKTFAEIDADLYCNSVQFISYKYGICGDISYYDDESVAKAESIQVFKKDLYKA